MRTHRFEVLNRWTGNLGAGTRAYAAYSRNYEISGAGKAAPIPGSSDAAFRGEAARYNPEELLVAALSACHMLFLLHLCADAGIEVTEYADAASGVMAVDPDGGGEFTSVILRPEMRIADPARAADALALHARAHELCFIARSVHFPVVCEPSIAAPARS